MPTANVLIVGAGGVGRVAAHKCAQAPEVFPRLSLCASRTKAKCNAIAAELPREAATFHVDADDPNAMAAVIEASQANVVINCALPAQNLPVMEACLVAGAHYVDTSAPEPDPTKYELFAYRWQQDYDERFREAGLTAVLSSGFDPGVVNVFCRYAQDEHFDEIHAVDIVDVNAGNHGRTFATNFDPYTNIQEIIQPGVYYEDGEWVEIPALSRRQTFDLPVVGAHPAYLIYHEELETLVQHIPGLRRIRFWMGFNDRYLTHLRVLHNLGFTRIDPIEYEGYSVKPLALLKELLPNPAELAKDYTGKTCIGCAIEGLKDGAAKRIFIYNTCDHKVAYEEAGSQAISYTTGTPAMVAARLVAEGPWREPGVHCCEALPPGPYLELLAQSGLPWEVIEWPEPVGPGEAVQTLEA